MLIGGLNFGPAAIVFAAEEDAELTQIRYNGIPIAGFDRSVTEYWVELPIRQKSASPPELTATLANSQSSYKVNKSKTVPGTSTIDVTSRNGQDTKTYTIHWTRSEENEKISRYTSYVGNSFSGLGDMFTIPEGGGWVQNTISEMKVMPDGTVYTQSEWDEGGRRNGIYKDGKVIGNKFMDLNSRYAELDDLSFEVVGTDVVGSNGAVISSLDEPRPLAFANDGQLMVGDNDTCQIVFYDVSGPVSVETKRVGEPYSISGIDGKADAGVIKPLRFHHMTGIGMDADGNIYVSISDNYCGGGTMLRCLNPDLTQKWQIECMAFVDRYDFDPTTNGADIYGKFAHYKMDYSKEGTPEFRIIHENGIV